MEWWLEPLPRTFGIGLVMALAVCFAVLYQTKARGSKLAMLASLNCTIFSVFGVAIFFFDLPAWRIQIFIERLIELPVVTSIAILCLLLARRMTESEPCLKRVLLVAPAALLSAWFLAFVGEIIWPQPILDPFAQMPLRNFLLLVPLCGPILFYLALLTYLFARAAGPRALTMRLKVQNFLLAVGICAYLLVLVNVVVGYGFQTFTSGEFLQEITEVQIAIEDRLFIVIALTVPLALFLSTAHAANRILLKTRVLELLALRDRFETRRWQLTGIGALNGLTRARYHARQAAALMNLSEYESEKTITTVELAAILTNHDLPEEISSVRAQQLLALHGEISRLEPGLLNSPLSQSVQLEECGMRPEIPDHFPEALEGAVRLAQPSMHSNTTPAEFMNSVWYGLASVVCAENDLLDGIPEAAGSLSYNRASRAYRESLRASA